MTLPPRRRRRQYHYELCLLQRPPYLSRKAAALKDNNGRQHELVIHWIHAVVTDRPDSHRFSPSPPTHPLAPMGDITTITTPSLPGTKKHGTRVVSIRSGTTSPGGGHVAKTSSLRLSATTGQRRLNDEFAPKQNATYLRIPDQLCTYPGSTAVALSQTCALRKALEMERNCTRAGGGSTIVTRRTYLSLSPSPPQLRRRNPLLLRLQARSRIARVCRRCIGHRQHKRPCTAQEIERHTKTRCDLYNHVSKKNVK